MDGWMDTRLLRTICVLYKMLDYLEMWSSHLMSDICVWLSTRCRSFTGWSLAPRLHVDCMQRQHIAPAFTAWSATLSSSSPLPPRSICFTVHCWILTGDTKPTLTVSYVGWSKTVNTKSKALYQQMFCQNWQPKYHLSVIPRTSFGSSIKSSKPEQSVLRNTSTKSTIKPPLKSTSTSSAF
jgi:hypothetical protein